MKNLIFTCLVLFVPLLSCNKNKCVTCSNEMDSFEICQDDDFNFSDPNGNPIDDFDAVVKAFEDIGYDCK